MPHTNDDKEKIEDPTRYYRSRMKALHEDASNWRPHWKDIGENMVPRKGRYLIGRTIDATNNGKKMHNNIINGSVTDAIRTIAAGLMSGLVSPTRPWFILTLTNKELAESANVKQWLFTARDLMLDVYARSNFYGAAYNVFKEMPTFGTGAMLIDEDFQTVIRCRAFTIGEYYLALDETGRPAALYRHFEMSASNIIEKFGMDNVSESINSAYKAHTGDKLFQVDHAIEKNKDFDPGAIGGPNSMRYVSVYWEAGNSNMKFLEEKGYRDIPFAAPRWDVTGSDTYGSGPGMDALGDVRMLQKMETDKLKALDKEVEPPMNAPISMKSKGGTVVSGGVNYVDVTQGQQSFTPAYQVRMNIQGISVEIDRVERRIERFFYGDLFKSILSQNKVMTATETARRFEEKLMLLGPVIERTGAEFLDPVIDRTFNIMDSLDMFPPLPEELEGQNIAIEYISLLAQAQKIVTVSGVQELYAMVAGMSQTHPEIADKFNADKAVDIIAEALGVPPDLIPSTSEVEEIRELRAIQQIEEQETAKRQQAIESAKQLSETSLEGDNALNRVIEEEV